MRQRLIELRDEQSQLLAQARAKYDEINDDTPDERAEEIEREHDRIMDDHDRVGRQADRLERQLNAESAEEERQQMMRDEERRGRRPNLPGGEENRGGEEAPDAMHVFTRALQYGVSALSPEERQVYNAQIASRTIPEEVRAQGTTSDAVGGALIPQGFLPEIQRAMAAWGPMLDADIVRELNTASGNPLPWPTVDDTANSSAQVAENVASPTDGSQDVNFGEKTLNAYVHRSGVIQVPYELLQDSAFDMQALLNDLLGERLGRGGNAILTTGDGTNKPHGIVTAAPQGVLAAATNAITFDEIMDLEHSVDPAYRNAPKVRYQMHDTTLKAVRKLKDGQGNYLWQEGNVRQGIPPTLNAKPYSINQAMAHVGSGVSSRVMLFGDMNKYIVRKVQGISIITMRERFAEALQIGLLAWMRFDGEMTDTRAVKHLALAAS